MKLLQKLFRDPLAVLCLLVVVAVVALGILAPLVAPHDPAVQNLKQKYASPSAEYPLGTDSMGRCLFSRLIWGIRTTVFLSFLTVGITIGIGCLLGMSAGYIGGIWDELVMRLCDAMLSFPQDVMILALVGILGANTRNIVLALVLIRWAWYTRMIRNAVLQYNGKNYILFARAAGAGRAHILLRHILPVTLPEVLVLATMNMGSSILTISSFSFLGLGIQPPTPEWGVMLNEAKDAMFGHPQMLLPVSVALVVTIASFHYLGDTMQDIMHPKTEAVAEKGAAG